MQVSRISPQAFMSLNQQEPMTIVDVRTSIETTYEYITNSLFLPLHDLTPETFEQSLASVDIAHSKVYLLCQRGIRADSAVKKLAKATFTHLELVVIEGGLNALKANGFQAEKGTSHIISLERQIRIASGTLVLSGVILGAMIHASFYMVSGLVGIGLMFSGITNTCGLGILLSKMPWNKGS